MSWESLGIAYHSPHLDSETIQNEAVKKQSIYSRRLVFYGTVLLTLEAGGVKNIVRNFVS